MLLIFSPADFRLVWLWRDFRENRLAYNFKLLSSFFARFGIHILILHSSQANLARVLLLGLQLQQLYSLP